MTRDVSTSHVLNYLDSRDDEHHRNVTFQVDEALRILADNGVEAQLRAAFGNESLPDGLVVLVGTQR